MFLYSNHLMWDYLGNVRYVSGILQYTDYDPLGKIIYSSNLDKNVYLYEGKERIPDIAEEYKSVYDFGARYYNPLYGRWFAPDPAKQGINPYVYCGNNPIMLVDPNGRIWKPTIKDFLQNLINRKIDELKTENKQLDAKIEERNNEGKKTEKLTKKRDDNEARITELEGSREAVDILDNDEHIYDLRTISSQYPSKVTLGDDGVMYIEGSSSALHLHEIEHVRQSIDADKFRFQEGVLLNIGQNMEKVIEMEILAYKKQYSFEPLSLPFTTYSGINGITDDEIKQIKYIDKNGVSRPLYQ